MPAMPRLIAIEGPEAGLALPVHGGATYLAPGQGGRVRLLRGVDAPALGAAIERVGADDYTIAPVEPGTGSLQLFANGREVTQSTPLNHGDLITFAGATLIFDRDDHSQSETTPGEPKEAPKVRRAASVSPSSEPVAAQAGPEDSIVYRRRVYDNADQVLEGVAREDAAPESQRLATLLKVAATLGGTLELPALLKALLDLVFDVVPAARGTILLLDRPSRKLRSTVGKVRGQPAREGEQVPVSRTIIREALRTRDAILSLDAQSDSRFAEGESIASAGIRSVVCVPVVRDDRILGVIHLDTGRLTSHFGRDELELVTAIAGISALALENARLFLEAAERERLRYELQLATGIQQRLLPRVAPRVPGLSVHGRMRPAKELGGDLYDFVSFPDGSLHIFVGDVSGKGVGASLIMAMARSYFRPLTRTQTSARLLVAEMNRLLFNDTNREIFMSAIYLRWDGPGTRLVYCGAGQEQLVIYRAATSTCELVPAGGLALAVVDEAEEYLEEKEVELSVGDAVVLYSDGVSEARSPAGDFFGREGIAEAVAREGSRPDAEGLVTGVMDAVTDYMSGTEQHDDMTVVALKCIG
ncbi:SpoIIE family protein phosphatase [Planctomycetota bacterium]